MQQTIDRRSLRKKIETCLREAPVTVLLGARQIGKTTLARMIQSRYRRNILFDLERHSSRQALSTPELTLDEQKGLVIIDEVQRMPELFEVLRPLADRRGNPASFLLLGSATPELDKGVSESLAGRALFVRVGGFSLEEVGAERQTHLWIRGGFPRAFLAAAIETWERWMEGFVTTFLERDLPQLGLRIPAPTMHRFWMMIAHCHGQILNASEIGQSMGISSATARRYLDILSGSFMVRILQPWHENVKKRQVKSPKIYIRDVSDLRRHPRYGASWEGFALEQVLLRTGDDHAWFWASQRGAELDLLLIRRGKRYGFEFKCADAPGMTKSLHVALADLSLDAAYVVYPGREAYPLHEKVRAMPLANLFKERLFTNP